MVVALRMGLQWRILRPESSTLQADGNGYIMNAMDVRGLGLVLKLTVAGRSADFPRLIQSAAVDKLACGIIPGDPIFVNQDYEVVRNDRKPVDIGEDSSLTIDGGIRRTSFKYCSVLSFPCADPP